jgi:hypothetical protein
MHRLAQVPDWALAERAPWPLRGEPGDIADLRVRLLSYRGSDLTNVEVIGPRLVQHFWVWSRGLVVIGSSPVLINEKVATAP